MSVGVSDYAESTNGFSESASSEMPGVDEQGMPTTPHEPQLGQDGFGGIPEDATNAQNDQSKSVEDEYEARFKEDKAALQRAFAEKENKLYNDLFAQTEQTAVVGAQLRTAMQWVEKYVQEHGDPRDLDSLKLEIYGAQRTAVTNSRQARNNATAWEQNQMTGHKDRMSKESVDEKTGFRLFDENDPEIQQAFTDFLEAGRAASRTGNPAKEQEAHAKWAAYNSLIERKQRDGFRRMAGATIRTPGENRAQGLARGPQNRLSGDNANVSNEALLEQARQAHPNDRRRQQAYFVQLRRKNNVQG